MGILLIKKKKRKKGGINYLLDDWVTTGSLKSDSQGCLKAHLDNGLSDGRHESSDDSSTYANHGWVALMTDLVLRQLQ